MGCYCWRATPRRPPKKFKAAKKKKKRVERWKNKSLEASLISSCLCEGESKRLDKYKDGGEGGGVEGELQDSRHGQMASVSGRNLCSQLDIIKTDRSTQRRKCKGLAIWGAEKICVSKHLVGQIETTETQCLVLHDENVSTPSLH